MSRRDVTAGCHGGMSRRDVTAGCQAGCDGEITAGTPPGLVVVELKTPVIAAAETETGTGRHELPTVGAVSRAVQALHADRADVVRREIRLTTVDLCKSTA